MGNGTAIRSNFINDHCFGTVFLVQCSNSTNAGNEQEGYRVCVCVCVCV